jgi:hypothetical protein
MRGAVILAGLLATLPAEARADGVDVDLRSVGCVVAGQYPRLNACFSPPSRLARARVYFRVDGAGPSWYYVEMRPDAPCHAGILPRPKKELVGRRILYYVDAFDRSFVQARTPDAAALVVARASDCQARIPVASALDAASVAVYPGVPAGFSGAAAGLGAGTTAALVAGGAAVVGGGVALAGGSGGSDEPSSPTTTPPPDTIPPNVTSTTTTTTTLASGFVPVLKVFRGATLVESDTVVGTEPLTLRFDMCETVGPLPLRFGVEVDGTQVTARCNSTITFTASGAGPGFTESGVRRSSTRTFDVRMTIRSEGPNNDPRANRRLSVQVGPSGPGGCDGDTQGPVVSLTRPLAGSLYPLPNPYPVRFEASASDATTGDNGIAFVEYKVNYATPTQLVLGPVSGASPWPLEWKESDVNSYLGTACSRFLEVQAYAQDGCGNATFSTKVQITVNNTGACTPDPATGLRSSGAAATLVSELAAPGAAGQVVANGEAAFPREGRSSLSVRLGPGESRVEATLVEARAGGTWRFDLGAVPGLRPGSLRVVAGDVVQVGADAVVFRLRGRPGERVVFSFRTD